MDSEKTPLVPDLPPAEQARQIKEQMQAFQKEVGTLRTMAQAAREQTLKALKESVLNQGITLLQQSVNSTNQSDTEMAKRNTKDSGNQENPGIIENAQQAMEYTDLQMAKIIDSMTSQVQNAMQVASDATSMGSNVVAEAMKQTQQAMESQPGLALENEENEVTSSVEQAEQNIADSLGNG